MYAHYRGQQKSHKSLKLMAFSTFANYRGGKTGGLGRNRTTDTRIFNLPRFLLGSTVEAALRSTNHESFERSDSSAGLRLRAYL